MQHVAVGIRYELYLYVPRLLDESLDVHRIVAERRPRLAACHTERAFEVLFRPYEPHSLSAAARGRLNHERVSDFARHDRSLDVAHRPLRARHERHLGVVCDLPRCDLVTHQPDGLGRRPYEDYPGLFAHLGELGVLGQKPEPRMNGLGPGLPRYIYDVFLFEITLTRRGSADVIGLVGQCYMERAPVGVGINGHSARSELPAGPYYPYRYFSPVRNQNLFEHEASFNFKVVCSRVFSGDSSASCRRASRRRI